LASAGSASFDFAAAFSASLHQQYRDELWDSTTHKHLSPQQNTSHKLKQMISGSMCNRAAISLQ